MREKIKKILFSKLNCYFQILVFILVVLLFVLVYVFYIFDIIEIDWENIRKINWETISAIALIITAVVIGVQSYYTKKYTEFAVIPSVFFTLRSIMRLNLGQKFKEIVDLAKKEKLIEEELNKMPLDKKLETYFKIINNSKFPALFRVKIDCEYEKQIIKSFNHYWENPLYVYPPGMMYPGVIILKEVIDIIDLDKEDYKGKIIIAHITYNYSPGFAPKIKCGPFSIKWVFDLEKFKWSGPDGVQEENLRI